MSFETMTATDLLVGLNLIATIGGLVGVLLRYERRLTALETHLIHIIRRMGGDFPAEVKR